MNSPRPCPNVSAAKTVTTAGLDRTSKTTCADELLPNGTNCPNFVNADLIAARSNPLNPERSAIAAGRIMINMIDDHVIRGGRFAFETTLNGPTYDRGLAGKPLAGFCTTPSKQITVVYGLIVYVIRFKYPLLHL